MYDMSPMHVLDPCQYLPGDQGRALLGKACLFPHQLIQLTINPKLLDKVDILSVRKHAVELDQVRVGQTCLDLYLAQELVVSY